MLQFITVVDGNMSLNADVIGKSSAIYFLSQLLLGVSKDLHASRIRKLA